MCQLSSSALSDRFEKVQRGDAYFLTPTGEKLDSIPNCKRCGLSLGYVLAMCWLYMTVAWPSRSFAIATSPSQSPLSHTVTTGQVPSHRTTKGAKARRTTVKQLSEISAMTM